jgi:hypothetical protein
MKKEKDGTLTENILDAESDSIKCKFNNDGCVELDIDKYSFITLSVSNLHKLIVLIERAEKKYNNKIKH